MDRCRALEHENRRARVRDRTYYTGILLHILHSSPFSSLQDSLVPSKFALAWNKNGAKDVSVRYRLEGLGFEERSLKERLPQAELSVPQILEDLEFHKFRTENMLQPLLPRLKLLRSLNRDVKARFNEKASKGDVFSDAVWRMKGRVVKPSVQPKFQLSLAGKTINLYTYTETNPYQQITAANGMVPRNSSGKVELFVPEMLPIGTEHIRLRGLDQICMPLGIDCAPALVGFEYRNGLAKPKYDGFVVCTEFAEKAKCAWYALAH